MQLCARYTSAHAKDWAAADDRGLGERSLLGLYDGGAVTAVAIADDVVGPVQVCVCVWNFKGLLLTEVESS
jgi:hypothetical protein